ncbi:MAG: ribonuclease E activity regulator RraA [Burkholderiaceae bacterium]|jgi:regulator of ribonuclease activity A|nr:ribonuclease E activity regulator RraA [Burkholderiaceae bacterium]
MNIVVPTTDLCDANEALFDSGELQLLAPGLLCFGARQRFCGTAATLKLFEDNTLLAQAVKEAGDGRVLVVDAGGSTRCAVLGGNLARNAADNGWAGVVVYGAVRDVDEIDACAVGVRALAVTPRRSIKRGEGQRDLAVSVFGARVRPGDWVYADRDGVLVSSRPLHR